MTATVASPHQTQLSALRDLSGRLGANPLLVQASTGNTSIKLDGVLWIKASGKWLVQADEDDFLVPVGLVEARRSVAEGTPVLPLASDSPAHTHRSNNRPGASIETAMHAVLPASVVIHVHSVNTICWAVRADAYAQLSARLAGLRWQWIPYTPSGTALARAVDHALSCSPETDVLVLGNHGLVICGESCRSAEQLLLEVERRLAVEPRPLPEPNLRRLAETIDGRSNWTIPATGAIHSLATDTICSRVVSGGTLYPCQAIFLPETKTVGRGDAVAERSYADRQTYTRFERSGVLVDRQLTRAETEMLIGLTNIVRRIDESAPLRYLTADEIQDALSGGGASYWRLTDLNAGRLSARQHAALMS